MGTVPFSFEHTHLILNPAAGRGRGLEVLDEALAAFAAARIRVTCHRTEQRGHARDLVRELQLAPATELVCGLGGDGTMHELLGGMMQRPAEARAPVALLPGGSGNSLMHDLGTVESTAALRSILAGRWRLLDLMELDLDGRRLHAFNVFGCGLAATAAARAESMRWLGRHRYTPATALEVLIGRRRRFQATLDGQPLDERALLLLVCNTQYTGRGMRAAPMAVLDDGLLDAVWVQAAGPLRLLPLLAKIDSGGHIGSPLVSTQRIRSFTITAESPAPLVVDGELLEATTITGSVCPGAIQLVG